MKNRTWAVLALFLGLFAGTAHAQAVASAEAFEKFMQRSTGAGKQTVGFARDGTPLAAPGVPSAAPDGGAGIKTTGTGSVRNPSGNPVGVTGTGRVGNAAVAGALGRFLQRVITPLAVGTAVYQLVNELKYRRNEDGSWEKESDNGCAVAPCYKYGLTSYGVTFWNYSRQASADEYLARFVAVNVGYQTEQLNLTTTGGSGYGVLYFRHRANSGASWTNAESWFARQDAAVLVAWASASEQAFLDEVAAKSGWPTSSAIAQAGVEAAKANGEKLPVESVTVTGPATSPGTTKTETSTNPDGSTKTATTTTTHNHTYAGDVITTTNITTTNITNNGTQGSDTVETKTEEPVKEEVPNHCEENPDTLGCTKLGDLPDAETKPKLDVPVSITAVIFAAPAGCPAAITYVMFGTSYALPYQPMCDLMSLLRPLFLALGAAAAAWIFMEGLHA